MKVFVAGGTGAIGRALTGGVALRYGYFYGPGTSIAADGEIAKMVRARMLPRIGGGSGVWSFIHVEDAASAAVAAAGDFELAARLHGGVRLSAARRGR